MKITKARLTEIIKGVIAEEAYDCEQDYRMGDMRERSERGYRGADKNIYDLGYGAGVKNDTTQNDAAFEKYGYDTPEGNAWSQGWDDGMGDGGWN